ncbi:iron transporter [Polaribacter reichenbachii]|uniref:Iron transporter n=1 Tax=Polaribacter reichenbachii TaxID=996801 RepID=A0A1B8U0B8_9FLAO|nr:Nramp family divalent metal transporter [Polaribacter reichenbachii]APZ47087.1 iron transporter [Polaribacter reichenbachii]AUC17728.1 iron transporter [Polaribacter reichenbachii]OBY65249.1 iron transporter [Polaribacter reichenbachii]
MELTKNKKPLLKRILALILSFGPGIFAIGYTIGTGSVTSMIKAGSAYGMQLTWVLLLSCLFSGILMFVYGNYTLITGETVLYSFKKYLKAGKFIAILIIVGVSVGQWGSLMGILTISANMLYEIFAINFDSLKAYEYETVLLISIIIVGVFYAIMLVGKYTFFEKILVVFVSFMGLSFIISLFFVHPLPSEVLEGLIPYIPESKDPMVSGKMMVAAFVGTTMAAATFLSRPLFVKGKNWSIKDLGKQRKDAITAAILVFIISGAIMAVASGALYHQGNPVNNVLDMAKPLEPIAGSFAVAIFFFGTLSAGLSSIFPCLLIAPLLIADYQSGTLDTNSKQFRIITGIACLVALIGPAFFGGKPILVQILSQVFNVFILPVVVLGIILLVNNKKLMKGYKTSLGVNIGLFAALFFSCIVSYTGVVGLVTKYL